MKDCEFVQLQTTIIMAKLGNRNTYEQTTDNRTFKILHISRETGCCLKCARCDRQEWYYIWNENSKYTNTNPNWKLVSKNPKQWMKKPIKIGELNHHRKAITW